jgi:hypothetical protein
MKTVSWCLSTYYRLIFIWLELEHCYFKLQINCMGKIFRLGRWERTGFNDWPVNKNKDLFTSSRSQIGPQSMQLLWILFVRLVERSGLVVALVNRSLEKRRVGLLSRYLIGGLIGC